MRARENLKCVLDGAGTNETCTRPSGWYRQDCGSCCLLGTLELRELVSAFLLRHMQKPPLLQKGIFSIRVH